MSDVPAPHEGIARVERALDEAYTRYAGLEEEVRLQGLTEALQHALAAEPAAARMTILEQLERANAPLSVAVAEEPVQRRADNTAEIDELRREIERLRKAPAAAPAVAGADPIVMRALIEGEGDRLGGTVDPARVAGVVQAVADFARDMVKGFLSMPGKRGDSAVQLERLRTALTGEITGSLPPGSTSALLNQVTQRVGVHLEAFAVASTRGAKSLLGELSPEVLEDLCSDSGFGPFKYRGMWETFIRRHRELADADDLFELYFDPAFRNAMYQLGEKK